jgi:ribosomal 50S subunit-associated protein YjgA (DUF615 family)
MNRPKIENVNAAIAKTKEKIAEYNAKLKELERQRTILEDAAIVAMFRKENMTDGDFAALLRLKSRQSVVETDAEAVTPGESEVRV